MKYTQSGNALIFILIAIFLLGGLTVLLSRTGSQSEDTGSAEQASIIVSEILKEASALQTAVQMLLSRGCSENTISFEATGTGQPTGFNNPQAPTNKSCHIYDPAGAGLQWINWPSKYPQYFLTTFHPAPMARSGIQGLGKDCTAASCSELYLFYRMYHAQAICSELNRRLNGTTYVTGVGGLHGGASSYYAGTFIAPTVDNLGVPANGPTYAGKKAGCYEDIEVYAAGQRYYDFYTVLIAR